VQRTNGPIRAVIFDLYNTLIYEPDFEGCFPFLAELLGVTLADYNTHRQNSSPDATVGRLPTAEARTRAILAGLGIADADGLSERLTALERDWRWSQVQVYSATISTLQTLRERGYLIGLVSDCTELMGRPNLERLDLLPLLDATALSYELGHAKPAAPIYLAATTTLGVDPADCLFVGDGGSDEIAGARALGMRTVRIDQVGAEGRNHYPAPADHIIVSLDELFDLPELNPLSPGFEPLDVSWVRRDLAVGGQIHPANLPRLKRMGIDSVVDLRAEESDDPELLASHDLRFLHLPMTDTEPLTQKQLADGSRWVAAERAAGRRVLVHCRHGVGRSVMLVAATLIDEGMPVAEALDHIKRRRPRMAFSDGQLGAIHKYGRSRRQR
jgi:HAD superfamily hydrolase (TIGR01509 family)